LNLIKLNFTPYNTLLQDQSENPIQVTIQTQKKKKQKKKKKYHLEKKKKTIIRYTKKENMFFKTNKKINKNL